MKIVPKQTHTTDKHSAHLFPIVCDRGQDGTKCLKSHGNIQKVSSKEEVVIVTQT